MVHLYSMTKDQAAIRDLFKVGRDISATCRSLPPIFPDQVARSWASPSYHLDLSR
jgi:hypothetical protein